MHRLIHSLGLALLVIASSPACSSDTSDDSAKSTTTASSVTQISTSPSISTTKAAAKPFSMVGQMPQGESLVGHPDGVFMVETSKLTITSYTSAGERLATTSFEQPGIHSTPTCMYAPIDHPDFPQLAALSSKETPAQGVDPGKVEYYVTLYDGKSLRQVWRTKVYEKPGHDSTIDCINEDPMTATLDTKWLVVGDKNNNTSYIIDATTGAVRAVPNSAYTVGNYLVTKDNGSTVATLDPSTLAVLFTGNSQETSPTGMAARSIGSLTDKQWMIDSKRGMTDGGEKIIDITTGATSPGPIPKDAPFLTSQDSIFPNAASNSLYIQGPFSRGMTAYDLTTMQIRWTQKEVSSICGISDSEVAVRSYQLAILAAADGKQKAFSATPDSCYPIFGKYMYMPTGHTFTAGPTGTNIYQIFN